MILDTSPYISDTAFPVFDKDTENISPEALNLINEVIKKLGYSENLIIKEPNSYRVVNLFGYSDKSVSLEEFLKHLERIDIEEILEHLTDFEVHLLYKIFNQVCADCPIDTSWGACPFDNFDFIDQDYSYDVSEDDILNSKDSFGEFTMSAIRTDFTEDARYAKYCDDFCKEFQGRPVIILDGFMNEGEPWVIYCLNGEFETVITAANTTIEQTSTGFIVHTPYVKYVFNK